LVRGDVKYWAKLSSAIGSAIYIYVYILASPYAYHGEENVKKKRKYEKP
jgi:hypothetical protein